MKKVKLHRLLRQYLNNTINSTDCNDLLDYLKGTDPLEIDDLIQEELLNLDQGPEFHGKQSNDVLKRIQSDPRFTKLAAAGLVQPKIIKFYQKPWLQIAGAVLVLLTVGLLTNYHFSDKNLKNNLAAQQKSLVIVPGSKKATLSIANGKVILLEDAANGVLAKAGSGSVIKTHSGQIIYHATDHINAHTNIAYNTLTTPKGGEYQLVLPDGTKVWLNSASAISYPEVFTGKERHVKLTGEAYFEVAKNKEKPFYVSLNQVQVKVLGTHFNITAYADDQNITATLLEGAVQVTKNKVQSLLIPGQQAVVNTGSDNITVSEANIANAIAWKNGYFIFNDEDIRSIMKKISRWYDVDIDCQGTISNQNFGGTFHRSKGITELLHQLERIGKVHFKITGRRITVME